MTKIFTTISDLFADYRAEWRDSQFHALFSPPPYLVKLTQKRPCFLIGGRGTGKTTTLRSLRFDSVSSVRSKPERIARYLGIYVRVNKNRVRAFEVPELENSQRTRAFCHYFNLLVCQEFVELTEWLNSVAEFDVSSVSMTLGLDNCATLGDLKQRLPSAISALELYVNNGGRTTAPVLSVGDAPIKAFCELLVAAGLITTQLIFCCIDEYENLSEEQQSALNTYLKHAEPPLSYKVGMRRGGLHTRATLNRDDQIAAPDDFSEVDIAEEAFESFAEDVANRRLKRAKEEGLPVPAQIDRFLLSLKFDEEADLLGCARIASQVRTALQGTEQYAGISRFLDSRAYFLLYWSKKTGESVEELARDWLENPGAWEDRLNNHGYASLFWLSKGRKGARIRKYYCGLDTFLALASGNIRYFLELIDEAIQLEQADSSSATEVVLTARSQTEAAKLVGKRRLAQIEGLSERGPEIKRLVLAIGKVFFEFARDPIDRAPEQNSFVISGTGTSKKAVIDLLAEGVAHLAFEETAKTKATSTLEMKDEEYRIHPIFCAFFEFSHRRKRRVTFDASSLLKLASKPSQALGEMMSEREVTPADELPAQLAMFTDFFDGGDAES
jgi:hypothetical protein